MKKRVSDDEIFTVCRTQEAIEIYQGCKDYYKRTIICSCFDQARAEEIAQRAGELKSLPVKNLIDQENKF